MLRIAIVDDHQIVRAGFRELLADELGLEIVFEAASGEAALESLREQPVDVLLRRVESGLCDPLELNSASTDGVVGMLQSVRSGQLAVANGIPATA